MSLCEMGQTSTCYSGGIVSPIVILRDDLHLDPLLSNHSVVSIRHIARRFDGHRTLVHAAFHPAAVTPVV